MSSRAMRSRMCSIFFPVPPYVAAKSIVATYSGTMSSMATAIAAMNDKIDSIMSLMAFNDNTGLSGYQYNWDFGTGTSVTVSATNIMGGFTSWGDNPLSNLSADAGQYPGINGAASGLSDLDRVMKHLTWTWLYIPQYPPGTARQLLLYDDIAVNDGSAPGSAAYHWGNLISVAPSADTGILLTQGSVFKMPPPYYRGQTASIRYYQAGVPVYFVYTGGQIYLDWDTDVTDSGGSGGTGMTGREGAGGGTGGAGGGGNQGP